jgi:hypothetical protein
MNNTQRSIQYIQSKLKSQRVQSEEQKMAYGMAIEVLEKQVQRKPLEIREIHDFKGNVIMKDGYCSVCRNELNNRYLYCEACGQAQDWSQETATNDLHQ